ncbi:dihydrodipicolinate synthase [Beutenbergia cavernae DSM 12333]|uniref:4-hydroxy-tetrahydrodipicolinate synthase n=1 Tax=Beutenbergia cavernae (strain ATCC BAA-8 / DSM 12333 / CCUG 43141 / JCM 11478 / NBRC 16432 / NCIMB 13614 / HKI 0122) TaxID=471853 RepID=C5BWQ0_BEUC1|nr:4-hydroxy-tetrahydrodipicolinate synthase [Beutenbergia cavernae]ACQ80716.1 dihydrodipicolinate synthase [Beutenbergia cavernae DSM 12333]
MSQPTRGATRPFGAVLTAMVTPMTDDGAVDLDASVRLARSLVAQGNDGLVLNGTTGEAPTTHAPEKAELVRAVADAVGKDAVVLAGAGSNDTAHAVRMAEQAAEAGADGLLVVAPYYSRPSQPGLVAHVKAVADATDLPVMLYDVPGRTGVRFAPQTLEALAAHDRVVAMKDATGDPYAAAKAIESTGLAWYSGDDAALLTLLALGGVGVVSVSAHVAAERFAAVVAAWDAADHAEALRLFRSVVPVIDALNGAGFQAVAAKAACEIAGLIPTRATRLPLIPATDAEVEGIRDGMRAAGLLDVALH